MDTSRDMQMSDRVQRLEQRNASKDRSTSVTDDTEEKHYTYTAGTSTDFLTTWRPPAPPASRSVPDSFAPPAFSGTNTDPDTWLAHFQRYVQYRQLPDDDVAIFPLFLKESAIDWNDNLSHNVKTVLKSLDTFKAYFGKSPLDYVFEEESIFTRAQHHKEKVQDYIAHMQKLAKSTPTLDDDLLLWVILKGLRPQIKASVIHQKAEIKSVADILELTKIAESAGLGKTDESIDDPRMNLSLIHISEPTRPY